MRLKFASLGRPGRLVACVLSITLSTAGLAYAALPNNTIIFGNKAYDLSLLNDASLVNEILAAFISNNNQFVYKSVTGSLTDAMGNPISAAGIPAVTYKDAGKVVTNYAGGDGSPLSGAAVWPHGGGLPADVGASHFGMLVGGDESPPFTGAWIRPHPGPFVWGQIESQPGSYNWTSIDAHVRYWQSHRLAVLATVWPYAYWDQLSGNAGRPRAQDSFSPVLGDLRYSPCNMDAYATWLGALVERYDGDGINDMPGLLYPIRHWEILNEPEMQTPELTFFQEGSDKYLEILRVSYNSIKSADPSAVVLTGGQAGMQASFADYWRPVLQGASGLFDAGNIHSIRSSDLYFAPEYRGFLDSLGYAGKPFWVTEAQAGRMVPGGSSPSADELARLAFTGTAGALAYGASIVFDVGQNAPNSAGAAATTAFRLLANNAGNFTRADWAGVSSVRFEMPDGRRVYALWNSARLPTAVTGAVTVITYAGAQSQQDSTGVIASVPSLVVVDPDR